MINAVHTLIYGEDPEAGRLRLLRGRIGFLRDVLGLPGVDTGGGWLIFGTGPSELAVHPRSWEYEGHTGGTDQQFDVSLMCDDLEQTMTELAGKGAEFSGGVQDQGWGLATRLRIPGAGEITLYQPQYDPPAFAQ